MRYATNTWEALTHDGLKCTAPNDCVEYTYNYTAPKSHNAGHGWFLSFGSTATSGAYTSPDGGEHEIFQTLHANNPAETPSPGVSYTRDGTYLRRKNLTGGFTIEFPNGETHAFDTQGRLKSITDPFGNSLSITYETRATGPFAGSTQWKITDTAGRTHYVYFRPGFSYQDGVPNLPQQPHEIVDYVSLAAPHGTTAEYYFDYNATPPSPVPESQRLARRCVSAWHPDIAKYVNASLLTAIRMPEGLTYSMSYDLGSPTTCSTTSGNITSAGLPSGGRIHWTYQIYSFPVLGGDWNDFPTRNAGVKTRRVIDHDGSRVLSDTEYQIIRPGGFPETHQMRRVLNRHAGVVVNATDHYFSVCGRGSCTNWREYGLPFARLQSTAPPFLSTEFLVPDSSGTLTVKRRTYVKYEGDGNLNTMSPDLDLNRRVQQTKTVFEDGAEATVAYSAFDGLGNYRTVTTGGTFGRGDSRTTTTNFNESAGTFTVDDSGALVSTFHMPATNASWLFTTFTTQTTSEAGAVGGGTAAATDMKTAVCFDSKGFMTSRRVHREYGTSPAASTTDLLAMRTGI